MSVEKMKSKWRRSERENAPHQVSRKRSPLRSLKSALLLESNQRTPRKIIRKGVKRSMRHEENNWTSLALREEMMHDCTSFGIERS